MLLSVVLGMYDDCVCVSSALLEPKETEDARSTCARFEVVAACSEEEQKQSQMSVEGEDTTRSHGCSAALTTARPLVRQIIVRRSPPHNTADFFLACEADVMVGSRHSHRSS